MYTSARTVSVDFQTYKKVQLICTPNPLPKYKDFVPQNNRFGVRTFEQLRADHLKYKDSGEPRSKVKNFNNCEFSSLFRGIGPVILKTSCMPLHISLGIGLRC